MQISETVIECKSNGFLAIPVGPRKYEPLATQVRAPGHASTRHSIRCSGRKAAERNTTDPLRARRGLLDTALWAHLGYVLLIFKVWQGFDFRLVGLHLTGGALNYDHSRKRRC